jgi:hypothetical protein
MSNEEIIKRMKEHQKLRTKIKGLKIFIELSEIKLRKYKEKEAEILETIKHLLQ